MTLVEIYIFAGRNFTPMFTTSVIAPFLRNVRLQPNETCLSIGDHKYTNAAFIQYISPIINELDAIPQSSFLLLMEEDVQSYAALFAGMLSGKLVVPVSVHWTDQMVSRVRQEVATDAFFCQERMQYFFRMTVEDAICRIDNGLYQFPDEHPMVRCFGFLPDGSLQDRLFTAGDVCQIKPAHPIRFHQYFTEIIA